MALAKNDIILHGVKDGAIKPLTLDNDTTNGLTYGSIIDIPGIQELTITPRVMSNELKADEIVKDIYTRVEAAEFSVTNAQISLDMLASFTGGTVTAGGSSTSETQLLSIDNTNLGGYFRLEGLVGYAKSPSGDATSQVADAHFVLHKCKITSNIAFTMKQDGYATMSFSGVAIGTIHDGKIFDLGLNETAADIS